MNPLFLWGSTGLWALSLVAWLSIGVKRFWSPWFLYLIFHLLSFVIRPWLVSTRGDQDYLHNWIGIPTTWADHEWALVQAMLALIAMSVGCAYGENRARSQPAPCSARMLDPHAALLVGLPLVVFGFVSLFTYGQTPWSASGANSQVVTSGSMYTSVSTTPAYVTHSYFLLSGVFLVWILVFGFRWSYAPLVVVFFVLIAYQEAARTTYVVGVISLVVAHLVRSGRTRPSLRAGLPIALVALSFVSGKHWLVDLFSGGRGQAAAAASTGQNDVLAGNGELFLNYETLVMVTHLVPNYADYTTFTYYGRTIYQFIPRAIWPGKPSFDYVVAYLSFKVPGIYTQGLTATLPGEAYVAFGPVGIVLILFAFGFALSNLFQRSLRYPAGSVESAIGIAVCMACFQVYRDGIVSLTIYTLFYAGPAVLVWMTSLLLGTGQRRALDAVGPAEENPPAPAHQPAKLPSRQPLVGTRPTVRGIHARRRMLTTGPETAARTPSRPSPITSSTYSSS